MIEKDMTATDRQFMIECLCEDIVPMIMEEYHLTDKEAFDRLYKLHIPEHTRSHSGSL